WTDDFAALENIMKMSKPGFKGTDYASALEKSYQFLLKEKGEKKVILVAGDAARHGFKNSLWKLRDSPAYSKDIIILGTYFKSECNNSYIKNVFINSAPEAKLSARIVNDGKKKSDYKIILTGNSFKEDRVVDGLSDKNSLIEFILPKKKQSVKGSQRCGSISLMEDSLSIDNEFFYAFKKPAGPIKTLLLYGNPNQLKAGYSAYFLKKLLNNSSSVDFKLSDAQRIEKNELKQYRLIICVGRKTAALLRDELKDFVSGGGKLWLIPSSLGREGAKNFARDYEFKTENLKTGAYGLKPNLNLSFFKENNFSGFDLDKIAVKRFLNIKEEKNILWEFKDARNETYPALLSKPLGLGSIALFTSSFDVSWSDMALKPVFADFIFSFIKLFSLADLNRKEKSMIYVGEKFKAHLSSPQSPKIKISGPQNKIYFEHPKNGNFIFERAHAPGIYRWTDSDGGNRCFAVNIDRRRGESELVKSNVPGSRINLKDPLLDFNAAVYGAQLWRTLLLIIVLLFILEGVLSEKI
ncbi:MAG: hypothetical protein U9Q34_04805, partial [Elusimicrobiota bacterium]|nr:hypothetical protein [Elusimicrobiota bacterium]